MHKTMKAYRGREGKTIIFSAHTDNGSASGFDLFPSNRIFVCSLPEYFMMPCLFPGLVISQLRTFHFA
jgi:hypothetical protein